MVKEFLFTLTSFLNRLHELNSTFCMCYIYISKTDILGMFIYFGLLFLRKANKFHFHHTWFLSRYLTSFAIDSDLLLIFIITVLTPTANHWPPTADCRIPTSNRRLPTTDCLLLTADLWPTDQPQIINNQPPSTDRHPATADPWLPTANCRPPTTNCQNLTANYFFSFFSSFCFAASIWHAERFSVSYMRNYFF